MFEGIAHELILLPLTAKSEIPTRLRSAGIEVTPSQKRVPARMKNAGMILACKDNKGAAEILIVEDAMMQHKDPSLVAVLIFPGRGVVGDWFHGTTDRALRKKIHELLYALKKDATPAGECL